MKRAALILAVLLMSLMNAGAKRSAPPEVKPVTRDAITYTAPTEHIGCVEARHTKTGDRIWLKQIYVIKYDTDLERDVQDCFINKLELRAGKLRIANECGGEFELDPSTLDLTIRSGTALVDHTAPARK